MQPDAYRVADQFAECITCPVHGNGVTPIDHDAKCDGSCYDTHAYWHAFWEHRDASDGDTPHQPTHHQHVAAHKRR